MIERSETIRMDPMWRDLPPELAEHVCNQLPKVRRIPENLKRQIVSQRWMLAKSYNWYLKFCMFHARSAHIMFQQDLGIQGGDINQHWMDMTPDERNEFYWSRGPGSEEARQRMEREQEFREWRDEWRETEWDS
jgi:hypothetical protein